MSSAGPTMEISSPASAEDGSSSSSANANTNANTTTNNDSGDANNADTGSLLPPSFAQDPVGYLDAIASQPTPSARALSMLAGPLAAWLLPRGDPSEAGPLPPGPSVAREAVAGHYLSAAAAQLGGTIPWKAATPTGEAAEVLRAVGASAEACADPRAVASSGIVGVLAGMVRASDAASLSALSLQPSSLLGLPPRSSPGAFPTLTPVHTVFLRCAVAAEDWAAAEAVVGDTWPLPAEGAGPHPPSLFVAEYYYLRGVVHCARGRGSFHRSMAHRCWWTCLSLPPDARNEAASASLSIRAWKKLALVQPLLDAPRASGGAGEKDPLFSASGAGPGAPTRIPGCAPKGLAKAIGKATEAASAPEVPSGPGGDSSEPPPPPGGGSDDTTGGTTDDGCWVYARLGPACAAGDRATVEDLLGRFASQLEADGNLGMARNCLSRARELQARKASAVFSVATLPVLARRWGVSPEAAREQLEEASETGAVPSRVDADGRVSFSPACALANQGRSGSTGVGLHEWIKLLEHLQKLNVDLSTSPRYHSLKEKEGRPGQQHQPEALVADEFHSVASV
ncbi:unnamed protein product [Pseudo-nitzschia multistriata]|uniref:COP9 signalosome complex subunit 3 n=1 Tax=Pseudo-nitzschia multistriata TaxID=183589 RepID=A0A448ZGH5_9STRA|nr:unnamed protein product [Pseudo-nitzschia multistriata]